MHARPFEQKDNTHKKLIQYNVESPATSVFPEISAQYSCSNVVRINFTPPLEITSKSRIQFIIELNHSAYFFVCKYDPTQTETACHSSLPSRAQNTQPQSTGHHVSSLLRQVSTHPNTPLSVPSKIHPGLYIWNKVSCHSSFIHLPHILFQNALHSIYFCLL